MPVGPLLTPCPNDSWTRHSPATSRLGALGPGGLQRLDVCSPVGGQSLSYTLEGRTHPSELSRSCQPAMAYEISFISLRVGEEIT